MSDSSVVKLRLKVPRSSSDLQLYDSEFQTPYLLVLSDNDYCKVLLTDWRFWNK